MTEITNWYENKNVFVTGATGFIGKCLVEKLLRDCPKIGDVYLVIRDTEKLKFDERKKSYVNHVVFSKLAAERPKDLEKIKIIKGDIDQVNLGISYDQYREICERVSIIFHSAADVRFDRTITDAYRANVIGTKHVLDFARGIKNLEVFVYVSTAFSQTHGHMLLEKHYPSTFKLDEIDSYHKVADENLINALSHKILGKFPNTYAFTKSMTEDLVHQYKDKFPIAVGRPSIVSMSWKEPLTGYTEGFHGINGWCLACSAGVLRTLECQYDNPSLIVPCDIVTNGLIVLAYERSKIKNSNEPIFFNIANPNPVSWYTHIASVTVGNQLFPFDYALWLPGGSAKKNFYYNFVCEILFQLIPALFLDLLLMLFRQRPIVFGIQRKIKHGLKVLYPYTNYRFTFNTSQYRSAMAKLSDGDRDIFYDQSKMEFLPYVINGASGLRTYIAKQTAENLPKAQRLYRYLRILDVTVKIILGGSLIYIILTYLDNKFFKN